MLYLTTNHVLTIPFYIHYADTYPVLLPILLCFYKRFRVPAEIRIIFWLALICGLINFIANLKAQRIFGNNHNNLWMYHVYAVISFILTTEYFISISHTPKFKRIVRVITLLFVIFSVINVLLWQGLNDFDSNGFTIASFVFIIYSILFYYDQLKETGILFIEKMTNFWIVTGIFFYYTGCFFLFLVYYNIGAKRFTDLPLPGGTWTIQQVMFIIQMLCFAIGILLCKPGKQILAG